jgi:quinol monooxygenase YgiN
MLEGGREVALTMDGCEGFEIYQSTETPEAYVMVERWATAEQHQRHFETNVIGSGVLDRVGALLAEPMTYGYFEAR